MLFGCAGILIAAGFLTEMPPLLESAIAPTNETSGIFVMTKSDHGREYVSTGTYRIRPKVDFEWKTLEPFESVFYSTPTNYVYSNEDEVIVRDLSDLRGGEILADLESGDTSKIFATFDILYKEEDNRFFLKAKPKIRQLKRALERVEAEGTITNWMLSVTFPNGVNIKIDLKDN